MTELNRLRNLHSLLFIGWDFAGELKGNSEVLSSIESAMREIMKEVAIEKLREES